MSRRNSSTQQQRRPSLILFQKASESSILNQQLNNQQLNNFDNRSIKPTTESDTTPKKGVHSRVSSIASNDTSKHNRTRSRIASGMFWENGVPDMPKQEDLIQEEISRRRTQSYDLLEDELSQKESELKMAAEIGLQLFEKSEAFASRVEELEIQVRDLTNQMVELELENEVMQKRQVAARTRQEEISKENVKLSTDIAEVEMVKMELEEAKSVILELEELLQQNPRQEGSSITQRRPSYFSNTHSRQTSGKYINKKANGERCIAYMESTCSLTFLFLLPFSNLLHCFCHVSPSISKTPKQVFFLML